MTNVSTSVSEEILRLANREANGTLAEKFIAAAQKQHDKKEKK